MLSWFFYLFFFFLRDTTYVSLFCLIICGHYLFLKYLPLWQGWLKLTKASISVIVNTSKPMGYTCSDHIPRKVNSKDKWWLPRTSTYTCVPVWSGQLPLLSLWEKYIPSFTQQWRFWRNINKGNPTKFSWKSSPRNILPNETQWNTTSLSFYGISCQNKLTLLEISSLFIVKGASFQVKCGLGTEQASVCL